MRQDFINLRRPLVIAHRGSSFDAPENTLVAFERAIRDGADGIELDVRLSHDRAPVCIHDSTLRRTADRRERVSEMTAAELTQFDAGTWFNRRFPPRADSSYSAARIPTLAEVLRCCRARTATESFHVYVEMKCARGEEEAMAAAVGDVLAEDSSEGLQIIVASFALKAIGLLRARQDFVRTAALFEPTLDLPRPTADELAMQARDAGAGELMLHRALATRRMAERLAAHELPLTVWTVDDARWARRARDSNLHALITNKPAAMRAAFCRLPVQ